MNKLWRGALMVAAGLALAIPGLSLAMDHGSMGGMNMGGNSAQSSSASRVGEAFHESAVDGYKLEYRLISMEAMMKKTPGMMKDMDMSKMKSHHLMVYVAMADGMAVTEGKIGYMIVGPGNSEQKVMAMSMEGGFGADVDLKSPGDYKITTKLVSGDKTLVDKFVYTAK